MNRLCLCLVLGVVLLNVTSGRNLRQKRQSSGSEEDVDDRYGFDRPNSFPNRPNRPGRPGNGLFPSQNGQNQFPGQNGQNQFPGQNGQNQFPGQNGQNQFPGQNGQNQFPGQNGQNQFPGQNGQGNSQNVLTTTESSVQQECIRNCPVTPEYNPVCGTNSVTYTNPGRLTCAQSCGVAVNLLRASPCPSTTTAAPPAAV